jgi:hypothetical protein
MERELAERHEAGRQEQLPTVLVAVLSVLVAFGPMSIDMYLPSLPAIGRSLNAGVGQVQFTVGFADQPQLQLAGETAE